MNRPVHFEILSKHPEKAAAFYRQVFGWEIAPWEGPQTYWLAHTGTDAGGIDGGFMHRQFEQPVINTVAVASLEDTCSKVEAAGGKRVHGPNEIPGVGLHAYCADVDGTLFGILQPAAGM